MRLIELLEKRVFRTRSASPVDVRTSAKDDSDIIAGWELCVTLNPTTPLMYLERFKERLPYIPRERPPLVDMQHACWIQRTKSWKELGLPFKDLAQPTRASFVGQVPHDGGLVLPFLIEYRRIVESSRTTRDRSEAIASLLARPEYAEIAAKSGASLAINWEHEELASALDGDSTLATLLLDAGFRSAEAVRAAPDSELGRVKGIGPKRLAAIRTAIGRVSAE